MRRIALALFTLTAACNPPPATPTTPPDASADTAEQPAEALPAAEEVLQAAVEAVGGPEKIASIKSFYAEHKMEMPAQNMHAVTKMWWQDGHFYIETDMPGVGVMRQWRNEEGVFADDPVNGKRKLDGKEAKQAEQSGSLVMEADWKKYYTTATTVARREADGRSLIDIKLESDDGDEILLSYDEETGLLREKQFKQETQMGVIPVAERIESYRDVDGFKVAERSSTSMTVMEATNTLIDFQPNVTIEPSRFKPE